MLPEVCAAETTRSLRRREPASRVPVLCTRDDDDDDAASDVRLECQCSKQQM